MSSNILRKFNEETLVVEESEPSGDKLSFDVLMHFINHTMKPQANYQPAMILFLLDHPNKTATRREIAEQLKRVNIKPDTADYEKVSVYGVLEGHNIVILEEGRSLSDDLFTLNVEDLDEEQTLIVSTELLKKIKVMENRSEASRKANETRGPEGRSEATRKGNETRNEFLDWIPSDENPALIFEHTCPKCNEVSVKYHKPPTEEENELVEKSFGWRGDIIQSYCIQCRSIKTENKKPGFFSRFQKKRIEKN